MKFLHYDLNLATDEVVIVTLDHQANVQLMDDINFSHYKRGEQYTYYGGNATVSPIRLAPPHAGQWNLVIDLGGYVGTVSASVKTFRP